MKNKGFTLIELLAVIVILAIIALIATPIILGIINDARDEAKARSAEMVYTGVQYAYTTSLYSTTEGTNVGTPTLATIEANLNIENMESATLTEDDTSTTDKNEAKLTIKTDDDVSCVVTVEGEGFDVTCGTASDAWYLTKDLATK